MKKHVIITCSVCLVLIALSGYFIHSEYRTHLSNQKDLLVGYVSQTKTQLEAIRSVVATLPYIVNPIIDDLDMNNTGIIRKNEENISYLKNYYIENEYFVRGISVYNMNGDALNILLYDGSEFIIDPFKMRTVGDLRYEFAIVADNRAYSIVIPVFKDNILTGNIEVAVDLLMLQQKLFTPFVKTQDIWAKTILDKETLWIFSLDEVWWTLANENELLEEVTTQKSGFLFGAMEGFETSFRVLSYHENLMIEGHNIGVAFSKNISSLIFNLMLWLSIIAAVMTSFLVAYLLSLYHTNVKHKRTIKNKDFEIRLLNAINQKTPVGILVYKNNRFFTGNDASFSMLESYISKNDAGKRTTDLRLPKCFKHKTEHDFNKMDLCKFESNSIKYCVSRHQSHFDLDGDQYDLDILLDVTEMEKNLSESVQSVITKSELLTRVSSEVKKTLEVIKKTTVVLMEQFPEEVRIASIVRSSAKLSSMLSDVQSYAEIAARQIELEEIPFNIVNEINNLIDVHSIELQEKGVELHTDFSSKSYRNVVGDPQYFRQIIDELLSNAVKFTKKGAIRISIETVDLQDDKTIIKCTVDDTGQGMEPEQLKNIFAFDLRTKKDSESIGLGIIIVKNLVDIMGGTLRVASPSPISKDDAMPGMQFNFSIVCYLEKPFEKMLDYSSITSTDQLNTLIVTTKKMQLLHLIPHLKRKGINSDIFVYNEEFSELLMQKLAIDKARYQIVILAAEEGEETFTIAQKIFKRNLSENCVYIFVDSKSKKGNYVRAKTLNMDYYLRGNSSLSEYDPIYNKHLPIISNERQNTHND